MQFKLEGPGTSNFLSKLTDLVVAATEAFQAFAQAKVKDMQKADVEMTDLHRRRQRLENEVKQLEERKKKALPEMAVKAPTETKLKVEVARLTHEKQVTHKAKENERHQRKQDEAPLTQRPFDKLVNIEAKVAEAATGEAQV